MDYEQDYTNLDIKDNGWYDDTRPDKPSTVPVSYTHLTLPTIGG